MTGQTSKNIFLKKLKTLGGRSGNTSLQHELGWDDHKYWEIHRLLLDEGLIDRGRGYGGSVILIQPVTDLSETPAPPSDGSVPTSPPSTQNPPVAGSTAVTETYTSELQLYQPIKQQLEAHWALRRQLYEYHCEITALQGSRITGGNWSRPDLVIIASRKYEFMPDWVFELFSFEVKPENEVSIKGVLEALAHRETATRSFVIYYTAGQDFSAFPEAERIEELAGRHGVGVYAAKDVNNFNEWAEIVTASRASPDPDAVDLFIKRSLSEEAKTKLKKWF